MDYDEAVMGYTFYEKRLTISTSRLLESTRPAQEQECASFAMRTKCMQPSRVTTVFANDAQSLCAHHAFGRFPHAIVLSALQLEKSLNDLGR
jgi:hypothetical protein